MCARLCGAWGGVAGSPSSVPARPIVNRQILGVLAGGWSRREHKASLGGGGGVELPSIAEGQAGP